MEQVSELTAAARKTIRNLRRRFTSLAASTCFTHRKSQNAKVPEVVDQYLVEKLLAVLETEEGEIKSSRVGQPDCTVCTTWGSDLRVVLLSRYSLV